MLFRSKDKAQGHGAGGLITAFVAQFYGGTVRIERTGEQGTVVVLELPVADRRKPSHMGLYD